MSKTMTPSEIADWHDALVVDEVDYEERTLHKAAMKIAARTLMANAMSAAPRPSTETPMMIVHGLPWCAALAIIDHATGAAE